VLMPTVAHLTERQHQLFFLFQTLIARHTPEGLTRLVDADVADAAAALAATLDTAARGVIYEHAPQSLPAQRLAAEIKTLLEEMRQQGATVYDAEAAIALKSIAQGARETASRAEGGEVAYLDLMSRLLQVNRVAREAARAGGSAKPGGSIILP